VMGAVESIAIVSLSALFPLWWLWKWIGPVTVILVGVGLLVWSLVRRPPVVRAGAQS